MDIFWLVDQFSFLNANIIIWKFAEKLSVVKRTTQKYKFYSYKEIILQLSLSFSRPIRIYMNDYFKKTLTLRLEP